MLALGKWKQYSGLDFQQVPGVNFAVSAGTTQSASATDTFSLTGQWDFSGSTADWTDAAIGAVSIMK